MKSSKTFFGTFKGVFVPTFLTILGIILFLRLPWVVGNAGVGGAIIIILVSVGITLITSLSLSSIITNIRIGAGGAFSIISRSLGLEIGGSIGIPLYLSQAIAVAMYIFGFREGWLWIFPEHSAIIVDLLTFGIVFLFAIISTNLAFKVQYFILLIVLIAVGSIVFGLFTAEQFLEPQVIGEFVKAKEGELIGAQFWVVFAVFFPAVTGIMAGLNMSGELKNPRRSIPRGTLWAVGISTLVYVGLAVIAGYLGTPDQLLNNYTFFIDNSFLPELVLAGVLGATFSSALTSFVGAPRVLYAIAEKEIIPLSKRLSTTNKKGEPLASIWFTGLIVISAILLRELNVIAPLITMFFLITYAMINLVVLIEQSLSLPSFRPTFKIPIYIPLIGSLSCLFVMFIVNPTFSIVAIIGSIALYIFFSQRHIVSDDGYARSGLFTAMAQWATKKAKNLTKENEPRAWQPDLLFPIAHVREVRACYKLLHSLVHPKGSIKILGIGTGKKLMRLKKYLPDVVAAFEKAKNTISFSLVENNNFGNSVKISTEALGAAHFSPNTIFLKLDTTVNNPEDYEDILNTADKHQWGALVYMPFARVGTGLERTINLWLRDVPDDWVEKVELGNNDLAIMTALLLHENWKGTLNIILEKRETKDKSAMRELEKIISFVRLPKETNAYVVDPDATDKWDLVPQPDINIFPTRKEINIAAMMEEVKLFRTSFLLTLDSGKENAQV
jgi:amino acid transporter